MLTGLGGETFTAIRQVTFNTVSSIAVSNRNGDPGLSRNAGAGIADNDNAVSVSAVTA
jgi:hypothetical protein